MTMRGAWMAVWLVACGGGASDDEVFAADGGTEVEAGCGDGVCDGAENYLGCDSDCSLPPVVEGDLSGCADGMPQADIDAELSLLWEVDQDVHEMVACGSLVFTLLEAMITIGTDLVEASGDPSLPDGYSWDGGTFVAAPDGATRMELALYWGQGFDSGASGELITDDLFDMDSYLIDPILEVDYYNYQLLIRHDGKGPLVELLGYGASPGRPVEIGLDDLSAGRWHELLLGGSIEVGTTRDDVEVSYLVDLGQQEVDDVLGSGLDSAVEALAASDGVRAVDADGWSITYVDGEAALDGTIDSEQSGGSLPMKATFVYESSGYADRIELACPDAR